MPPSLPNRALYYPNRGGTEWLPVAIKQDGGYIQCISVQTLIFHW